MQLGFVIDHSRCIGCHACTVACKSENDVPLGSFRTWVKYVEEGTFPDVRRNFAVLRCNQCSDAPCVEICPVTALDKRADGIVDVDHDVCIGCKACMQACPYDALYINEDTGTAEKCHFCAHRTELGLAPACAVVCPTEAIIPGDFHDPASPVARMKATGELTARKTEAGTGPNVWYRDVAATATDPCSSNRSGGLIWANNHPGPQLDAETFLAMESQAEARTVYDTPHRPLWGWKITGYLWAKSVGAGVFLAAVPLLQPFADGPAADTALPILAPILALLALTATAGLLVGDLKRPDRFLSILLRPNWNSWLAKGSFIITAYAGLITAWLAAGLFDIRVGPAVGGAASALTAVLAAATAAYTGWLFGQAKGRVLWMKRFFWVQLLAQAFLAGGATLLLWAALTGQPAAVDGLLVFTLLTGLGGQLAFTLGENAFAPEGRRTEYLRATRLLTHGPYARTHWVLGVGLGLVVPIALLLLFAASPVAQAVAAVLALVGLWVEEDLIVRAGQALPIS